MTAAFNISPANAPQQIPPLPARLAECSELKLLDVEQLVRLWNGGETNRAKALEIADEHAPKGVAK